MDTHARYISCVYHNLRILQSRVVAAVNCSQCTRETICFGHYDNLVRLQAVNPAPDDFLSPDGFNLISDSWIYASPTYAPLDATNMSTALGYLMSTPSPWPSRNDEDTEDYQFLLECITECSTRGTSAPLLLFAINIHELPNSYRRLVFQVYLITIGSSRGLAASIKGLIWVDRIISYLRFHDTQEPARIGSSLFINGDLDDEGCPYKFILHEIGLKYEVEVVFDNLCFACSRQNVQCAHGDRLVDIAHSLGEDRELIFVTPASAYTNRI